MAAGAKVEEENKVLGRGGVDERREKLGWGEGMLVEGALERGLGETSARRGVALVYIYKYL